jgi:hypothetical protein
MTASQLRTGSARHAISERGNDLYETPSVAVLALMRAEKLPRRIWEPAAGRGAIVKPLQAAGHDVLATDLVDYDCGYPGGVDFLIPGIAESYFDGQEAIVTNPPFKNAAEFVERALTFTPYVAMLLRLAFLESERRRFIIDDAPLARVRVFRKRLPAMHRDGWAGTHSNSGMAFAWFIWERDHTGPTELHRLSWEAEA